MDTRKVYDMRVWNYRDFKSVIDKSRQTCSTKNRGYDVSEKGILNKCVSKYLYRESRFSMFLMYVDKMMVHFINSIKRIQFYNNFSMKEDDTSLNI